ncbi:MAG: hypothetical protein C0468_05805, partial [Planctomyces sp.]|nr:hypothetical protein [Planctomyces sp.]
VPDAQRWNNELKGVGRIIGALCNAWNSRAVNTWCHGDLHGGNALRRHDGACVLIDFALAHAGHWVEDALYLERSLWSLPAPSHNQAHAGGPALDHRDDRKPEQSPLSMMAALRRAQGLPCQDDYARLANTRRLLAASIAPAIVEREGNARYLARALSLIVKLRPMVEK